MMSLFWVSEFIFDALTIFFFVNLFFQPSKLLVDFSVISKILIVNNLTSKPVETVFFLS